MAKPKLKKFDPVDYLLTQEDIELYLKACRAEAGDDPIFMARIREDVARARRRLGSERDDAPDLSSPKWKAKLDAVPVKRRRPKAQRPTRKRTARGLLRR